MGGTLYSDAIYSSRVSSAATSKTGYFTHDHAIKTGAATAAVHEKLDPSRKNAAGKVIRESFDSTAHPNSIPIAVLFDVTGSMSGVPRTFVSKLGNLMRLLVKKGYVQDPHILFGAIGDAKSDQVPLQIGQFESGNEMDEVLSLVHLEAGGGGQQTESYELGMYFMARHSDLDSFKKRGKKGYVFLMGDETPYPKVSKKEVLNIIGDSLEADIPTEEILAELRRQYEVFWIIPGGTNNYNDTHVNNYLTKMFGQNLLKLPDANDVCELIATTIGVCEGVDLNDIGADLKDVGSAKKSIDGAITAVAKFASTKAVSKKTSVKGGKLAKVSDDGVEIL